MKRDLLLRSARARRLLLWLCLVALVVAQALGFMHRVAHRSHGLGMMSGVAGLAVVAVAPQKPATGWLDALFAGHDDDGACRLYDQLGHGDAMPGVNACVLPLLPAAPLVRAFEGAFVARWAALFDARGPPSVR